MKDYIYIDFENLNNLKKLNPITGKYIFFIGASQTKINTDLVVASNTTNVEWIKVTGNGKNALDFHIVYYLAKHDEEEDANHYILSKDTGFDPLIKHLVAMGKSVKRIITIDEVVNKNSPKMKVEINDYDICYNNLSKISKAKRPKSIKTLTSHCISLLGKNKEAEVENILNEMFRRKFISSGSNNRLTYMS